jgi:hypothetical protein
LKDTYLPRFRDWRAAIVLKLRQKLKAVHDGRAMAAAVWLKDAELNVFSAAIEAVEKPQFLFRYIAQT